MKVVSGTAAAMAGFRLGVAATVNKPTEERAHAAAARIAAPM